jgi:hypothetical protein
MSTVLEMMTQLNEGKTDIEAVVKDFSGRDWAKPVLSSTNASSALAVDQDDPEPTNPDSFDVVSGAWLNGIITDSQYESIRAAVFGSVQKEDTEKTAADLAQSLLMEAAQTVIGLSRG